MVSRENGSNSSSITKSSLLTLAESRGLRLLRFRLFLGVCLAALLGCGLLITAVACGHCLHPPHRLLLGLGCISSASPGAVAGAFWGTGNIFDASDAGCVA